MIPRSAVMLGCTLALTSCVGAEAPQAEAVDDCAAEPYPQLQITCRVQAAARLAQQGQAEAAQEQCLRVADPTWRDECHFRMGEELAAAGQAVAATTACAQAGWFARRCVTHAAWRLRLDSAVSPTSSAQAIEVDGQALLAAVTTALSSHSDPGVAGEGRDAFRAAWGRALYLGFGVADPGPAHVSGELGPALRTGWAVEAVRILTTTHSQPWSPLAQSPLAQPPLEELQQRLLKAWRAPNGAKNDGAIRGAAADPSRLPPQRYAPLQLGPHDQGLPHLPMFGGGLRLVGETVDEDAEIAILEAIYSVDQAGPELFSPTLTDPRPRLRWTAARLTALAAQQTDPDQGRQRLAQLADLATDAVTKTILTASAPPQSPQQAPPQ